MLPYVFWWIVAAVLVGLELLTGTFYLLVYGAAAASAGFVAWLGPSLPWQLLAASIVAAVGTVLLRRWKRDPALAEHTVQDLDIGRVVEIERWQGTRGQVRYRGTLWDAEFESEGVSVDAPLIIRAVRGNTLIVGN